MKKAFFTFVAIILLASSMSFGQEKLFTYEDAIYLNRSIHPARLSQLTWKPNENLYTWVANNSVIQRSANNESKVDTILRFNDFANLAVGRDSLRLRFIPAFKWTSASEMVFISNSKQYKFNVADKSVSQLSSFPESGENLDVSPAGYIAYTIDNNLFVSAKGNQLTLTLDSLSTIVNGQTVHRNEFGISKGTYWSPKGTKLAFYRKDESKVGNYPLVDITTREAEVKNIKYPMAGMDNEVVKLGIFDVETEKTIFVQTGDSIDQYLTNVTWAPEEDYIYITILNRDQNHIWLNQYSTADGSFIKTLFEEKSKTWIEPELPMVFLKNNPNQFIWFSERNGWMHMYLYTTEGQPLVENALTQDEWVVTEFLGFSESGNEVFFAGTKDGVLQNHIYSVDLKSKKVNRLTEEHGTHQAIFSPDFKYFIDSYSSTDMAKAYEVRTSSGKKEYQILSSKNPLSDYKLGQVELGTLEAEDGSELHYGMIKPIDFDSTKKYPVFLYVYGGPHAQLITDSWLGGANIFMQLMAQKGYVVFTLDNRGTPNRGFEFESVIHRKLGKYELEDQLTGVEYLTSLPFVDADRIGVHGWSYGGFMTINMLLSEPKAFKVGVAGGPVINWKYYEIMYGERYMDTPEQNPEGYKSSNLLEKVKNLNSNLLIIHGAIDETVVWQHSLAFVQKAIEEKKQIDYFVYPRTEHNVRGIDRAHLLEKVVLYFENKLK